MRILAHISLALLLLASSMGATVYRHYCGNRLQAVGINVKVNPCGKEVNMPEGCCHDEATHFSVDHQYQGQNVLQLHVPLLVVLQTLTDFFFHSLWQEKDLSLSWFADHSSPPAAPDIYILVQSFLI